MQAIIEVGETSTTNQVTIEVDLQKTIKMITKQKNVIFASMEEEDEHVLQDMLKLMQVTFLS